MANQPGIQPKVFKVAQFESVIKKADTDQDGHLTQAELEQYKLNNALSTDDKQAAEIMHSNFRAIAYRALKTGTFTTMEVRKEDSTIELDELKHLAGFDNNSDNVTIEDFKLLQRSNTSNWPVSGGKTDDTVKPSEPETVPKTEPENTPKEKPPVVDGKDTTTPPNDPIAEPKPKEPTQGVAQKPKVNTAEPTSVKNQKYVISENPDPIKDILPEDTSNNTSLEKLLTLLINLLKSLIA